MSSQSLFSYAALAAGVRSRVTDGVHIHFHSNVGIYGLAVSVFFSPET